MASYQTLEVVEEALNPLRRYRHLIPTSSNFVPSLTFHLFAANISVLFPIEDPDKLRLVVAQLSDQAINHKTGDIEKRHLFYAALMHLSNETSTPNESVAPTALMQGPAVPYFSPPILDAKSMADSNNSSFSMTSKAPMRNRDENHDAKECKEKAITLLMAKLDREVHSLLAAKSGEELEIWDAQGWKFAPAPIPVRQVDENRSVNSVSVGWGPGKIDGSSWFSKI